MKRITGILLSVVLLSLTFTGCSQGAGTKGKEYDIAKISSSVVEGNSGFAFDIFKKLNGEDWDKSIFISPLSISTALTMTYNGAESTTKEAMGNVLGFKDIDRDRVNESYKNLLNYIENVDKKVELNVANSIWIREGQNIKEDFISRNKDNFNTQIDTLDFSRDSAANTINKWIDSATKGKIDKMLEPPISPNVIMYLINAIYFKGQWTKQFDSKRTFDGKFKSFDGSEQAVKMMNMKDKVEYTKGVDYKAVRLPYGSGKTSMYCLLPGDGIDINEFIKSMSLEKWADIRKNIKEVEDVILQIPRFKLEYGIKILNDSLKALGIEEAFSDRADFSGIREGINISRVLHKAVIEVNEEGSEAAAATVVEMKESAAMDPITFIANRPFVFIIADDTTGTILFMGKLLRIE